MHASVHTLLSRMVRMNKSTKTARQKQTATDGMFELGSLLDELNRRYKLVETPTKEDEEKEQSNETTQRD